MSNDDTAPAIQGDVRYLAELVGENKLAIEKIDKRFDALEERIDERFYAIEKMFRSMTQHVTRMDQRLETYDQRIRSLELAS